MNGLWKRSTKLFWGEPQKYCLWIGWVLSTAACFAVLRYTPQSYNFLNPFLGLLLGLFVLAVGWIIARVTRTTFKALS